MSLSEASKQNLIYLALIMLTSLTVIGTYRLTQGPWIVYRQAENKYKQKEYAEAIPLYKYSLDNGVTALEAVLHLADSYVVVGKFEEAIIMYRNYLINNPKDKNIRLALAKALEWSGNLHAAEIEYQKILENNSE